MNQDYLFMNLALELAQKGMGAVSPNPMVGAVVVKNGMIVGKGYHQKAGTDHAEVIALKQAGNQANSSTLYVTLEPCSHFGKTPPCTKAIIKSGIKRVVFSMNDPNKLVSGSGERELIKNGIETLSGILENEARSLNEVYLKYITTGMPFLTLKLAVTLDGKVSDTEGNSRWITNHNTRTFVHAIRAVSDAIMVGSGTIKADNPLLDARNVNGRNPLKVIVDSSLSVPLDSKVFLDNNVIVAVTEKADQKKVKTLTAQGIEVMFLDSDCGRVSLLELIKKLGERNITSILCEGGPGLAASLVNEKLVDKFIFTIAPKILGNGLSAFNGLNINKIGDVLCLKNIENKFIDGDTIITGYPENT